MPRRKQPHRFEVIPVPFDPLTPFHLRRALYTRLSHEIGDEVSHSVQQLTVQNAFGISQELPLPKGEDDEGMDKIGHRAADRGYVITAIYRDWRTGVDVNRLAMKQLIADAHAGKHAGVLFRDDDRLFRDLGVMPWVVLWQELGKKYHFEAALGAFSIEDWAIHAHMSGREREKTRMRTMMGRRARAARGEAMHTKLPYWLERDPNGKGLRLSEERAEYMREAIRMYERGMLPAEIAAWLTEYAPVWGESPVWSTARLRVALRSPAMWGSLDYGRHKLVEERRNGEVFVVARVKNPDAVPFKVPPLIHRTELERAQCRLTGGGCACDDLPSSDTLDEQIKANNVRTTGRPWKRAHPLRRRVVCACGWRMAYKPKWHGTVERQYGYLTCCRHAQRGQSVVRDLSPCPTPSLRSRALWPQVERQVVYAINHPDEILAAVQNELLASATGELRTPAQDAALLLEIERDLAELDAAENRLYKRYDKNEVSKAVYDGQTREIAAERQAKQESKRQILDREQILARAAAGLASLREGLIEAQGLDFAALSMEEWTTLFDRLVADVVLDPEARPSLSWNVRGVDLTPGR